MPKPVFATPSEGQAASVLPRRMINPVSSIRSHKILGTVIFLVVIAIGAGVLYWMGPKYTAAGEVELEPRPLGVVEQMDELSRRNVHEFVSTAVNTLRSRDTFLLAIDELRQQEFIERKNLSDAQLVAYLAGRIDAERVENSLRIRVTASDSKSEGLHHLVNAVINAYLEKAQQSRFPNRNEIINTLETSINDLEDRETDLIARRAEITAEIGKVEEVDQAGNPYSEAVLEAEEAYRAARQNRVEVENLITRQESRLESPPQITADTITEENLQQDPYYVKLQAMLNEQKAGLEAQMVKYKPEHPSYKEITRRLAEIEEMLTEAEDEAREKAIERIQTNQGASLRANLENAKRELESLQAVEDSLQDTLEDIRDSEADFRRNYQQAITLTGRIEQVRQRKNRLQNRLEEVQTESTGPSDARLGYFAPPVTQPNERRRQLLGLMFFLAAIFLAVVIPTFLDWMDPWIKTPADVESVLRVQPLGWILEARNERTTEFANEQIRRLALAIDRQRRNDGRRIFVLTSIKSGGGTSELVLKISRQLGAVGVRALAIESNAYEGDSRFGGESTGPGLGAVLRGESEIASAIRPGSQEEGLPDRVPVGVLEERQIHENGRLVPAIRSLESQYDIFLLDAPPLLVSADAELLCGMADAVLLVVEAEGVAVGELRRAAKQLDQIAPPIMGVVVNRVRVYGTGYFKKLIREYESGEKVGGPGLLGRLGLARRH